VRLEGPRRKLVGLEMVDRGVPRHGYAVALDGRTIGEVTTGMYAPTPGKYLALALVLPTQATIGTEVQVMIRGEAKRARVVKTPFYTPAYRRQPA
jgi:aminomethyltransferase